MRIRDPVHPENAHPCHPRRQHPWRQQVPAQACHRQARQRRMKIHHHRKRGWMKVLTAISSAKKPRSQVEIRKAHDMSADLACIFGMTVGWDHFGRCDHHGARESTARVSKPDTSRRDIPRSRSAAAKGWRMNIATLRLRARVCTADLSCKNPRSKK